MTRSWSKTKYQKTRNQQPLNKEAYEIQIDYQPIYYGLERGFENFVVKRVLSEEVLANETSESISERVGYIILKTALRHSESTLMSGNI